MSVVESAAVLSRLPKGHTLESVRSAMARLRPKVVVLRTQWYPEIMDALQASAEESLAHYGVSSEGVEVWDVPGSFELPLAARWAYSAGAHWVIALGCVIKGDTPHFDFVCQAASEGLLKVSLEAERPLGFGLLTLNDLGQASSRKSKGAEAVQAALSMALLAERR